MSPRRSTPRASEPRSPTIKAVADSGSCCSNRWTHLNLLGLVLNLSIFGFTIVLYHRILGATEPCIPDDHAPPIPMVKEERLEKQLREDALLMVDEKPKQLQQPENSLPVPVPVTEGKPKQSQPAETTKEQAPESVETEIAIDTEVAMPQRDPDRDIHIIFSTGCGPKQNWQAYVLYHSIMESGQIGHVTRIASGCLKQEAINIRHIHKTQIEPMGIRTKGGNSRFHLHLTPEFGYPPDQKREGAARFMYMNKPYGVAHWMEKVLGYSDTKPWTSHDETIIMLLDPDMIILRPIVNDFSTNEVWRSRQSYPKVYKVTHGYPFSQEYGFGMWWYNGVKNISTVLPVHELPSPVQNMTKQQLTENYTAGPPYIATARDFYKIVAKWREIAWPVQRVFPDTILAEMFSYSWAAAHLNLPHQQGHSFMVSAHFEQGFHLFRRNKNITSSQMCRGDIPTDFKPHILHYCQRYAIGKYFLGKHRLPQTVVGHSNITRVCQSPLLVEPPTNISTVYDFYIDPEDGKRYPVYAAKNKAFSRQEHLDRITFMLCEMIAGVNRAATYFKQQHCGDQIANYNKSLFFHQTLEISRDEFYNTAKQ